MLRVEDIEVLKVFREATQWDKDGEVVLRCGGDTARVYFAGGKIAWAIVSSNKRTFTRYLVEHSRLEEEEVQEVFKECQNSKGNLAETIIEWGLLDEASIRRLLLEHLAECLLEVFCWKKVEAMFMPEGRKYEHDLTFDFMEVLQTLSNFDVEGKLPFGRMAPEKVMAELEKAPANDRVLGRDLTFVPRQGERGGNRLAVVLGIILIVVLVGVGATAWYFRAELFKIRKSPPKSPSRVPVAIAKPVGGTDAGIEKASSIPDGGAPVVAGADLAPPVVQPDSPVKPDPTAKPDPTTKPEAADGLHVVSKPAGSMIYLDGINTGHVTPYTFSDLAPGAKHVVLVAPRGRIPAFEKVTIKEGVQSKVELNARRKGKKWKGFGSFELDSDPAGALIIYNGKKTSKRTPAIIRLPLHRPSRMGLVLEGYKNWEKAMHPIPKDEIVVRVTLDKK